MEAVRIDRAPDGAGGTLAVIVLESGIRELTDRLVAEFGDTVGLGADGLARDIAVITPQDAKGLEFDSVVVVDPVAILASSERGAGALYVAMTRATQRLTLVAEGELPVGTLPVA